MGKIKLTQNVQKIFKILFIIILCLTTIGVVLPNSTMAYSEGERCLTCLTAIRWTYNSKVHGYYCDYCADWYGESTHNNTPADYIKTEFYMSHTTYYVCKDCDFKTKKTEDCYLVNFTKVDSEKHEAECKYCRDVYVLSHIDEDNNGKCDDCKYITTNTSGDKHTCNYSKQKIKIFDDTYHDYIGVCSICGDEDWKSRKQHTFGKYEDNEDGTHSAKCKICNYKLEEKHDVKKWTTDNDKTHTGICTICNNKVTKQHNFQNGKCTQCSKEQYEDIEITSKKYMIKNKNISNIQIGTTVKGLRDNLQTNATEINVYNSSNRKLSDSRQAGTGMKVELKNGDKILEYTVIVNGDVNGDGKASISDMFIINSHRLNLNKLAGIYLQAADVNEDSNVDIYDILKINRYRLTGQGL